MTNPVEAGQNVTSSFLPIRADDPRAKDLFPHFGLTTKFPDVIKNLNDVIARKRTQFHGFRITLSPEIDNPTPILEVKRTNENQIVVDVDADELNPSQGIVRLSINGNLRDIIGGAYRLRNLQKLITDLIPEGVNVNLIRLNMLSESKILNNDFLNLTPEELALFRDGSSSFIVKIGETTNKNDAGPIFFHFGLPVSVYNFPEQVLWLYEVGYTGDSSVAEKDIERLTKFLDFTLEDDPDLDKK